MHKLSLFTLSFSLLLLASGCGSQSLDSAAANAELRDAAASAGSFRPEYSTSRAELDARWQEILVDPGVPGVDYDPNLLTISFLPGASLPARLKAQPLPSGCSAASQGNARLRKIAGYGEISDSIAARFGLKIENQVYLPGLLVAGFELPKGANGTAIISAIKAQYAGIVEHVTYSRLMYAAYTPSDPDFISSNGNNAFVGGGQWGLKRIGCEAAWDISRGSASVQIAVVDSGVRLSHEEFVGSNVLVPEVAFPGQELDVRNHDNTVEDTNGHGTFIAGLVGAHTDNARTIASVAHNCQVIPIKIANGGVTADFRMLEGVALAVDLGAEVVNLSWGGTSPTPNLEQLVAYCKDKGVLFVCAAGNDNTTDPDYPGAYPDSLCVGASFNNDQRCEFSNYGDYVDIAAPGEALKSCSIDSDTDYSFEAGTSYSAPIVAAAAGLLLSIDPTLTPADLREALLSTTAPTTGFSPTVPVGRLNLAAAIETVADIEVLAPQLDRLVQSGLLELTPTLIGKPDKVELYVSGNLTQTVNAAPFTFQLDTTTTGFGPLPIDFIAYRGTSQSSVHLDLVVDNLAPTYPLQESFEGPGYSFASLDAKRGYSEALLNQLIQLPSSDWDAQKLNDNGPGQWRNISSGPFDGNFSAFCGTAGLSHGAYEIDCMISRRINLVGISNASMVFYSQHNLEDGGTGLDRAMVFGSFDGQAWTPLSFKAGGTAYFTGNSIGWTKREVDLSSFDGLGLYVAFVMATDGNTASGQSGFWLDKVTIASDFNEDVATIGGFNHDPYEIYGAVPDLMQLNLSVTQPVNVNNVKYILDLAPLGSADAYDEEVDVSISPFDGAITLPEPNANLHNQLANLVVRYYDASAVPGPEIVVPVYIFNQLGDTNADGQVNNDDIAAYAGKVGLTSADPGYIPFFDSDLDGVITELDAAAVGYFFGSTL